MKDEHPPPTPQEAQHDFALKSVSAGAETVVGDHVASSFRSSPAKSLFWFNLIVLIVVALFATYWFQEHLEPYFTEVLLIGGSLTLWALIRLAWEIFEKMTKLDPWDR